MSTLTTANAFLKAPARSWALTRWAAPVIAFSLLTAMAAQVSVPVPGSIVPMTLQSLVVLLAGATLAPMQAFASMALYVSAGTFGLPVFKAGSVGLFGFTGGYLVGFVIGAFAISLVRGQSRNFFRTALACTVGLAIILACGAAWLSVWTRDIKEAFVQGVAPFLLKGVIELGLAVVAATLVNGAVFRIRKLLNGSTRLPRNVNEALNHRS